MRNLYPDIPEFIFQNEVFEALDTNQEGYLVVFVFRGLKFDSYKDMERIFCCAKTNISESNYPKFKMAPLEPLAKVRLI